MSKRAMQKSEFIGWVSDGRSRADDHSRHCRPVETYLTWGFWEFKTVVPATNGGAFMTKDGPQ